MISVPHTTHKLTIGELTLTIWVFGIGKPEIIFLHGFPKLFSQMEGDLPIVYLYNNHPILAFDMPEPNILKKHKLTPLDIISSIIKHFSRSPVILFGVSYGGILALQYTFLHPNQVRGVIVAGTPYFPKIILYAAFGIFMTPYKIQQLAIKRIFRKNPQFVLKVLENLIQKRSFSILKNLRLLHKKRLSQIRTPILLLYSSNDEIAGKKSARMYEKHLQNSKLVLINGGNHGWLLHRIDKSGFLHEINEFLNNLQS